MEAPAKKQLSQLSSGGGGRWGAKSLLKKKKSLFLNGEVGWGVRGGGAKIIIKKNQ